MLSMMVSIWYDREVAKILSCGHQKLFYDTYLLSDNMHFVESDIAQIQSEMLYDYFILFFIRDLAVVFEIL